MVGAWRKKLAAGLVAGAFVGIGLAGPLGAAAAPGRTGLSWPKDPVQLSASGSSFTGSFTVFNPTAETIEVTILPAGASCQIALADGKPVEVKQYSGAVVNVTTHNCHAADVTDLSFEAHAASSEGRKQDDHQIHTQPPPPTQPVPNWAEIVLLFVIGGVIAAVAVGYGYHNVAKTKQHLRWYLNVDASAPPSWLANITAVGALFSGFFVTTDLFKSILGSDPSTQLAFIAVGASLSVALAGAATLVTGAPTDEQGSPQVWQFLLGAALTGCAALGQIGVVAVAISQLSLGLSDLVIWGTAAVAGLLLAAYVVGSVRYYVEQYAKDPNAPAAALSPSPKVIATLAGAIAPHYLGESFPPSASEQAEWIAQARALGDQILGVTQSPPRRKLTTFLL